MENISKKEAERLLQLFMEGKTGGEEHEKLRQFFLSGEAPEEWEPYRLLLSATFRDAWHHVGVDVQPSAKLPYRRSSILRSGLFMRISASMVAVAAAVILGLWLWPGQPHNPSKLASCREVPGREVHQTPSCKGIVAPPFIAKARVKGKAKAKAKASAIAASSLQGSLGEASASASLSHSDSILENVAKTHQQIAAHRQAVRQEVNDLLKSYGVGELCATE